MSELRIEMQDGKTTFSPGEEVAGVVTWRSDEPLRGLDIDLLWETTAREFTDTHLERWTIVDDPPLAGQREFSFKLPNGPYSFNSSLVRLTWFIEAKLRPGQLKQRVDLIVSPWGAAIDLPAIASK